MSDRGRLEALSKMIAAELDKSPRRPVLRLVGRDDLAREIPEEDPVMRESRIARIRWLARSYGLHEIVRQRTFGRGGIDTLDADELLALHRDMERGLECVLEGVPIDEAGLIRAQVGT